MIVAPLGVCNAVIIKGGIKEVLNISSFLLFVCVLTENNSQSCPCAGSVRWEHRGGQWDLNRKEGMQHAHWERRGGGGGVGIGGGEAQKLREKEIARQIGSWRGADRAEIG